MLPIILCGGNCLSCCSLVPTLRVNSSCGVQTLVCAHKNTALDPAARRYGSNLGDRMLVSYQVVPMNYQPYDDRTQLARQIDKYPKSFTRNPAAPLIRRPLTLSERTGPIGLAHRLHARE